MGSVTEADIAHYHEHGHVTIRRLLARTDTERLVERLDGMLDGRYPSDGFVCGPASRETPDDPGRFILQVMAARFPINDPVLAALSGNRRLRAAAAALMGSEHATVFQQQALIKGVDAANATPWHQDDHYWQLARGGYTAVTAWMPLRRTPPTAAPCGCCPAATATASTTTTGRTASACSRPSPAAYRNTI